MSTEKATLAGGCFWGMQDIIRKVPGVLETRVGYTGGTLANPIYQQVCTGTTGHAEALEIIFENSTLSFERLLENFFFRMHDPTSLNQQGGDRGTQYRSAIFFHSEDQRKQALQAIEKIGGSKLWGTKPVVTQVVAAAEFYEAEENHQDYLEKHPDGYTCHYLR